MPITLSDKCLDDGFEVCNGGLKIGLGHAEPFLNFTEVRSKFGEIQTVRLGASSGVTQAKKSHARSSVEENQKSRLPISSQIYGKPCSRFVSSPHQVRTLNVTDLLVALEIGKSRSSQTLNAQTLMPKRYLGVATRRDTL